MANSMFEYIDKLKSFEDRPKAAFWAKGGSIPSNVEKVLNSGVEGKRFVVLENILKDYYGPSYEKELSAAIDAQKSNRFKVEDRYGKLNQSAIDSIGKKNIYPTGYVMPKPDHYVAEMKIEQPILNTEYKTNDQIFDLLKSKTSFKGERYISDSGKDILGIHMPQIKDSAIINEKDVKEFETGSNLANWFSIMEHEAGHITGKSDNGHIYTDALDHLAQPVELENGLGRINRENFLMNGFRFSDKSLKPFIKNELSKPEEERFKGFSKEALRVFKVLSDSYSGKIDKKLIEDAGQIVDQFVANEADSVDIQKIDSSRVHVDPVKTQKDYAKEDSFALISSYFENNKLV